MMGIATWGMLVVGVCLGVAAAVFIGRGRWLAEGRRLGRVEAFRESAMHVARGTTMPGSAAQQLLRSADLEEAKP